MIYLSIVGVPMPLKYTIHTDTTLFFVFLWAYIHIHTRKKKLRIQNSLKVSVKSSVCYLFMTRYSCSLENDNDILLKGFKMGPFSLSISKRWMFVICLASFSKLNVYLSLSVASLEFVARQNRWESTTARYRTNSSAIKSICLWPSVSNF